MQTPNQQHVLQQKYAEQKEFELIEQCVTSSSQPKLLDPLLYIQPISSQVLSQAQTADRLEQTQKLRELLEQVSLKNASRSRSAAKLLPIQSALATVQTGSVQKFMLTQEDVSNKRSKLPTTPQSETKKGAYVLNVSPSTHAPLIQEKAPQSYYDQSLTINNKQVCKRQLNQKDNNQVFSFNSSTKEHTTKSGALQISTNNIGFGLRFKPNINYLQQTLKTSLLNGIQHQKEDYNNIKVVNDLIYNEQSHIVTVFKDFLILDDINEFLKRTYSNVESTARLPKLCQFYDSYSQVFPNYVCLPESAFMFKNISKKQKLIDEQNQTKNPTISLKKEDRLFDTKFKDSVMNQQISKDDLNESTTLFDVNIADIQLQHQRRRSSDAPNLFKKHAKLSPSVSPLNSPKQKSNELVDLMENFLQKDSQQSVILNQSINQDFLDTFYQRSHHNNLGQFSGRTSQIRSEIMDSSMISAFYEIDPVPEKLLISPRQITKIPTQVDFKSRPKVTASVESLKKNLDLKVCLQQETHKSNTFGRKNGQSKSPDRTPRQYTAGIQKQNSYYNRSKKVNKQLAPATIVPLKCPKPAANHQSSQEQLTAKIPKAIKTLELTCRLPQKQQNMRVKSPSFLTTPLIKVNNDQDQTVDQFLDVEINRGKIVSRKQSQGSGSLTEEDTVRSDGNKSINEKERLCPSSLIMAGRMSIINTASQSLRGSVVGLISASKHQQSLASLVSRAQTVQQQNAPFYKSQARSPTGLSIPMTRLVSPMKSSTVSSPVNKQKQTPRSTEKPIRNLIEKRSTIQDIKSSQDFSKIKRHLESVYLSGKCSQTQSIVGSMKAITPLARVLEERQSQFDLKFRGLMNSTTALSTKSTNATKQLNKLIPPNKESHESHTKSYNQKFAQKYKPQQHQLSQCRLQQKACVQSKSPTTKVQMASSQQFGKRTNSKAKNDYRPLQTGHVTMTRTGLAAASSSPTPTQQTCITDTHNTRELYSSRLQQTVSGSRSPLQINQPSMTRIRNLSPHYSVTSAQKSSAKQLGAHQAQFILPLQKKPQFFGQHQIQAMGALISNKTQK